MDNMNRTILIPLVTTIILALKTLFHVQFTAEMSNAIVDLGLSLVTLVGIFMHPTKDTVQEVTIQEPPKKV